jgi:ferritin-like metal-binding protein YciE
MAKVAQNEDLAAAFEKHHGETKAQIERAGREAKPLEQT